MSTLFWLSFLLTVGLPSAWPEPRVTQDEIVGRWMYIGFIHDGKRYDRPNPDLLLFFAFDEEGTHRLSWSRRDEEGFCERRGPYRLDSDVLWQKVTWLNPRNDSSCGGDPDMQLNKETVNLISLHDQELGIHMDLNGKEFIYLLQKVSLKPENKSLTAR